MPFVLFKNREMEREKSIFASLCLKGILVDMSVKNELKEKEVNSAFTNTAT